MIGGDPAFDEFQEVVRLRDDLLRFRMRGNRSMVIVDHVALAAARVEEIEGFVGGRSERQPSGFECQPVMAGRGSEAIARARNGHFRGLQCSVVRRGIAAVVRERLNGSVLKVACDERAQFVEFSFGGLVGVDPAFGLPLFPSHSVNPRW
jgi:hypothetical protein